MKKWVLLFLTMMLVLGAAAVFADTGGYRKNCIEGTGCLDAIDGDHAYMLDGSHGYVIYNGMFYPYYLDDDSAAAESGVTVVAPTTNGGDKRWLLAYPGGFTASRALASDADGKAVASDVTADELGYVDGVTSAIQTQLNGKIAATGVTYENLDANGDVGTGATQVAAGNHSHSGYESSSSNDFDPDRLAGDTSDDNLIDAAIVAVLNQATTGSAGSVKSPATTGVMTITGPAAGTTRAKTVRDADDTLLELGGSYTPTGTWDWSSATISAGVVTSEVDGDTTNEVNTITGDDAATTSGLAITIAGAGIASTAVAGDTLTVTATEVDGSTTNEVNTVTADDANTTTGLAITVAGGGIAATTVAGDTVTVTATEVDSVVGAITGIPKADGAGTISAAVAGTDYAAADHDATHAVGGTDTVFPADPGADRYLMWDDDPGQLTWAEVSAGGLFDAVTGIGTAANATLQKADPALIFDGSTATDTDYWMGLTADEGGDDDDLLQWGDGTTPGTNPHMSLDTSGRLMIGTTDNDGTPAVGRMTIKDATNNGTTYPLVLRDSDEANILTADSNGIVRLYNKIYMGTGGGTTSAGNGYLESSGINGVRVANTVFYVSPVDSGSLSIVGDFGQSMYFPKYQSPLITQSIDSADRAIPVFTIKAGPAYATAATNIVGGNMQIEGGAGASGSAGAANGGNVLLDGGLPYGTGVAGDVHVGSTRGNLVIAHRVANTPMTFEFTDDANITDPLTSSIVLLDGDNDGDNDTIDLQDGETAGQYLEIIAHADIDADDTVTINYADTTCTNCPAVVFDKVGENARYRWTGATWVYLGSEQSL